MKITYSEGCMGGVARINGVDIKNVDFDELRGALHAIIDHLATNELVQFFNEVVGSYHSSPDSKEYDEDNCDACGTVGCESTWEIVEEAEEES